MQIYNYKSNKPNVRCTILLILLNILNPLKKKLSIGSNLSKENLINAQRNNLVNVNGLYCDFYVSN